MRRIFNLGEHNICGIHLSHIDYNETYLFMLTFFFVRFTIHYNWSSIRFGIGIGTKDLYARFQIGID